MPRASANSARTTHWGAKPAHVPYGGGNFVVMTCDGCMAGHIPLPSPRMQQGPLARPVMEQNLVICPMGRKVLPRALWWGRVCPHAL